MMRNLSKSRILSNRQCAKKLWLEINHRELAVVSDSAQRNFNNGNKVGEIAHQIYDPNGVGQLIDPFSDGFEFAFNETQKLLDGDKPIFEAAFSIEGGLVMADVLLPVDKGNAWRMIEVKSSTGIKDIYLDDVAIQSYVSRKSGLNLAAISLGHIDNTWVYQGDGKYSGLIAEVDLTAHAISIESEVEQWFESAHKTASLKSEPNIKIGAHCSKPYDCPFFGYCSKDEPVAKYPVSWLPRIQKKALKEYIAQNRIIEMADVPDDLLNEKQLLVKKHTLENTVYFDLKASSEALNKYEYPYYFLDFETINLAIPIWKGVRAYQQVPFQFSLHYTEHALADNVHKEFLDISGADPALPLAKALIASCGSTGPIFVWYIGFESSRIKELASRFKELEKDLLAIEKRLVDLLPIAAEFYYNPNQQGSWSIKKVLPAISDEYDYSELEGVQDGGMAMDSYVRAIYPDVSSEEKQIIEKQLLKYCEMDTLAMVEILKYFCIGPVEGLETLQEIINNQHFSLKEVQDYFLALAADQKEYRSNYEKSAIVAGGIFDANAEKCISIFYRARALSMLVTLKKLPGWVRPNEGELVDVHKNILTAIGLSDLNTKDGDLFFDVDNLLSLAFADGKPD